jgi:Flp pilus assembly pilin Flp
MEEGRFFGANTMKARRDSPETRERAAPGRLVLRLLRDETAVTTLEYVVAAVSLALAAVAASRIIAGVLKSYLHRIYLVVTLPIP